MIRCEFIPYEGEENYIFVSYAHKDAEVVFPVIEQLHDMGYRIWYDDGIAPGSEWPEDIANHLNGCALMMAFITPNSLASANCRREITYALAKKKAFLGVILEPVEMTPGIEMQLSAQQCVMKYSYHNDEAFFRKLCSCQGLASCRTLPSAEAAAPETETPAPAPEKAAKEPAKKPVHRPKAPKKTKATKPVEKKKLVMTGGILLAALAVVLAAVLVLPGILGEDTPEDTKITSVQILDEKVSIYETVLYLSNETVTKDVVEKIGLLENLESVTFAQCGFEEGALAGLSLPGTVDSVFFRECTGVDDLQFLTKLLNLGSLQLQNSGITDALFPAFSCEALKTLDLGGNGEFTDLTKISGFTKLNRLDISGTGVQSLEALAGLPLYTVDFSGSAVADISALAQMQDLDEVIGAGSKVRDISPLANLEGLNTLNFNRCDLDTPEAEFLCLRLATLCLANTGIENLDAFRNLTVLRNLDISGNSLTDVSVIAKSSTTLRTVNLSGNEITGEDIAFLADSALTEVYLDGIPMTNLNILKNSPELLRLSAVGCGIQDISGLSDCTKMTRILLANNEITSIAPLKMLSENFIRLDLSFNPIRDVSFLPVVQYNFLGLLCEEMDPSTFPDIAGNTMTAYYSEKAAERIFAQGKFTYVILNCPADKQVALEDAIGAWRLELPRNLEQLVEILKEKEFDVSYLLEE